MPRAERLARGPAGAWTAVTSTLTRAAPRPGQSLPSPGWLGWQWPKSKGGTLESQADPAQPPKSRENLGEPGPGLPDCRGGDSTEGSFVLS